MPAGEGGRGSPVQGKEADKISSAKDDSDGKTMLETYGSSGNGSPVTHYFHRLEGIYADTRNQGYGETLRKDIPVSKHALQTR